jgi:hypothetical protein
MPEKFLPSEESKELPRDEIKDLPTGTGEQQERRFKSYRERLEYYTRNGGLEKIPDGYDEEDGDWRHILSENPFEVLYLDYREIDKIRGDKGIIERNYEVLKGFWREKQSLYNMGANKILMERKYGRDTIPKSLSILEMAYRRLMDDLEGEYKRMDGIRFERGREFLERALSYATADKILTKEEEREIVEQAKRNTELSEGEIKKIIDEYLQKTNSKRAEIQLTQEESEIEGALKSRISERKLLKREDEDKVFNYFNREYKISSERFNEIVIKILKKFGDVEREKTLESDKRKYRELYFSLLAKYGLNQNDEVSPEFLMELVRKTDELNIFLTNETKNKIEEEVKIEYKTKLYEEQQSVTIDEIAEKLKLIITERNITESDKLNTIRERISKWSNSIPYHDFIDLGDKIELISAKEKPSYIVTLQTQYEKRELKHGIRPYRGEKLPPKSIDEENVDIWAFNVMVAREFEEKQEDYIITESQEVSKCMECKGKGEIICYSCQGAKEKICSYCSGRGEIRCKSCGGRGEQKCWKCGGSGQIKKYVYSGNYYELRNCSKCGGRGYYPCPDCRNGYINCHYCGGSGKVNCETCNGRGILTCNVCQGWGEVVTYLYFTDIFKPILRMELVNHPDLPKEIISGESIHIYHEGKEAIKETIEEQEGDILLEITQKIIPNDIFERSTHIPLKDSILQLLSSSIKAEGIGTIGKNCRIVKQRLTIKQINALHIVYKYLNKQYTLWLYGKENVLLFAPVSPISEVSDSYYASAQDLFRKKEFSEALDLIEKVLTMQPKREEAKKLKETIINKIGLQYIIGGVSGGIISGTLTSSILFLLTKLYLSLDELLINSLLHGVIFGLIGIVIGRIFNSNFSVKIRESKKRFLYPFLTTVVFTILSIIGFYFLK